MLAIATREQRTLTGAEATGFQRHLAECDQCRALTAETEEDWRWVARIPEDAFDDPNLLVLPVVDPIVFDSQREIASGGMGRITRANDRRLGREVAIKEVLEPQMRARFEREAMITARLQHPAIVPIYEAGMWPNGSAFYTMRLVKGGTLAESIALASTMAERLALLPHVVAMTEALAYAHSRHIIHRDLKPGNVLVGSFGETVVIDWGLAKELDRSIDDIEIAPSNPSARNLTRVGAVMGTPGFMSPEQASGDELDERADVYALGGILYNLLTGIVPYFDKHATDTPDLVIELGRIKPPTPIDELAPDAPADLRAIALRAMARPKEARYRDAQEMAEELRRFQTGQLIGRDYSLRELIWRWIRKHRTAVLVGLVAFVALAVVTVFAVVNVTRSRAAAVANLAKAETNAAATLEEQARTELLLGDHERGLAYANEAYRGGRDTPALRFLLAVATRDLDLLQYTIGPPELTTVCGKDVNCAGSDIASLAFGADGVLVLVENTGRLSTWKSGKLLRAIPLGHDVGSAELGHHAKVAAVGSETSLELWDAEAGTRRWTVPETQLAPAKLVFDPADKQLLALSDDDEVHGAKVRDVATGAVVATLDVGEQHVANAAFSADGHLLAACSADGAVHVWDTAKFDLVTTWKGTREPKEIAFAGPDRVVVDGEPRHTAEIWRISDAKRVHQLRGHHGMFMAIGATVRGDLIATGDDRVVRLWNANGELLAESRTPRGRMEHLIFGPGNVLIGAGLDNRVYIWETPSLDLRRTLDGPEAWVDLVAYDPAGGRIATSTIYDQHVRVWRMPAGNRIARTPSRAAAFAGGGVVVTTAAGTVLLRRDDGGELRKLGFTPGADSQWTRLDASRDGKRILFAEFGTASVLDVATDHAAKFAAIGSPVLSADGRFVLDEGADDNQKNIARVLDATSARVVLELAFKESTNGSDISPDGDRIAVGFGNTIKQWRVAGGEPLVTVKLPGPRGATYVPHYDPTGKSFVVTNGGNRTNRVAIVFDAATGAMTAKVEDTAEIREAVFSRDGLRLLTWNDNHVVRLWDAHTGRLLASVDRTEAGAYALSNDGKRFATGSNDGLVRLWDTDSGRQLATFRGHRDPITDVAFDDAGNRMLVRSSDDYTSLWDVHLETRPPAAIGVLADKFTHWKLVDGLLVAK